MEMLMLIIYGNIGSAVVLFALIVMMCKYDRLYTIYGISIGYTVKRRCRSSCTV